MSNMYYAPEKHGLRIVTEIEWRDEAYEFDITVLWQAVETGKFYVADDSGCSCPSPFELTTFEDLIEIAKLQELIDYLEKRSDKSARVTGEIASMIGKYRDLKK